MTELEESLQKMQDEQGFLVVASCTELRVGAVVRDCQMEQGNEDTTVPPITCMATATHQEWCRQEKLYGDPIAHPRVWPYYYKCRAE